MCDVCHYSCVGGGGIMEKNYAYYDSMNNMVLNTLNGMFHKKVITILSIKVGLCFYVHVE